MIAPWDAKEYGLAIGARSTGQHLVLEQQLASRFPPVDLPKYTKRDTPVILTTPLVVVDHCDCIICWYLPGVLTENRQVGCRLLHQFPQMYKQYKEIIQSTKITESLLDAPKALEKTPNIKGWRSDWQYFTSLDHSGCLNVLLAWHQQGHEVSGSLVKTPDIY